MNKNDDRPVVISVKNVGKKYIIKNIKKYPIDGTKFDKFKFRINKYSKSDFWALKDISFEVREGDRLAIVGRNGAGKSTLLKLITRITEPTEGSIEYYGIIAAMLEVGTGFNPELTGRENVYLNGAILGMSKEDVDKRFDGIVEFSEVGQFIDTPVKRYSSGMKVRLAFAVASTLDPDILIVDEVLSVGDMKFREKCLNRMSDIAKSGKTILCVSHVMNIVRGLCNRAIVLDHGKMIYDGEVEEAIDMYNGIHKINRLDHRELSGLPRTEGYFCDKLVLQTVDILDNPECVFYWNEPIRFTFRTKALVDIKDINLRVRFARNNGAPAATAFVEMNEAFSAGEMRDITICINKHNLAPGDYQVSLTLTRGSVFDNFDNIDSIEPDAFSVTILNVGTDNKKQMDDDASRMWLDFWGRSRIMDVTSESATVE
ncbi:MAG: ATP-binding cassette domain-containing protein [Clostridia bacterium]|nr:ATP-binding cassette domain-containing protein [Clostridia bacterium]